MVDLAKLQQQINDLSDADWQRLVNGRKALKSLNGTDQQDPNVMDDADGLVLDALTSTLTRLSVEHASIYFLRKHPHYSLFKTRCSDLMPFFRAAVATRNEQRLLLELAMELLYKELTEMGIAVSCRTMMNHVHRIPAVLNKHFPGYAASGLLSWILKTTRKRGHT